MVLIVAQRIMTTMSLSYADSRTSRPGRLAQALRWLLVGSLLSLLACSPALNWREVRFENASLVGWLPCKPDQAQRQVDLNGQAVPLRLMGCEADGMDFTLAQLQLPAGMGLEQAQQAWKTASLASLQASGDVSTQPWSITGASPGLVPQRALAQGGQGRSARWAWFAYDGRLYQAAVYARAAQAKQAQHAMDTLLSGLRLP
jgi:hypothetical protein